MLLIHGSLALGGVETLYVKIAKIRKEKGKKTVILILSSRKKSNLNLVFEAEKHAELLFLEDFVPFFFSIFSNFHIFHLSLMLPIKKKFIKQKLESISVVHVGDSFCAFFAAKLMGLTNNSFPIILSIYHSCEYMWGNDSVPFFERKNREFFFEQLPRGNVIFCNESTVKIFEDKTHQSFKDSNVFPIGVIENNLKDIITNDKSLLKEKITIGSIGRLVEFKSYNLWMIDVVHELKHKGHKVEYIVYGTGPFYQNMKNKIRKLCLENEVHLKGLINFSEFKETVKTFDIFIGSGTSIIEASGAGIPSIIGIENCLEPESYGYLCDIEGYSYNENTINEKIKVIDLIRDYIALSKDRKKNLSLKHITKSKIFSMDRYFFNVQSIPPKKIDGYDLKNCAKRSRRIIYSLSFFFYSLFFRLKGTSFSEVKLLK